MFSQLWLRKFIVERITVIKFGVGDKGSNGTGSWRIEVRPDTAKLTNVIVTGFGERCNSVREGIDHLHYEAKIPYRVGGVKWRVTLTCLLRPWERLRSIVISTSVCVCLSVRLSARITPEPRDLYQIFCACCLWLRLGPPPAGWRSSTGKGQFWVFPIDSALYGPYNGMNFATKDRFWLNIFIFCIVGHNSISYY